MLNIYYIQKCSYILYSVMYDTFILLKNEITGAQTDSFFGLKNFILFKKRNSEPFRILG